MNERTSELMNEFTSEITYFDLCFCEYHGNLSEIIGDWTKVQGSHIMHFN